MVMEVVDGAIVCMKPGTKLTDDDRQTIREFAEFLRARKEITDQYEGDERQAKLAELTARYEAEHCDQTVIPPRGEWPEDDG